MEMLSAVVAWFADPSHWAGPRGIVWRTYEHVYVSVAATVAAATAALPAAVVLAHRRRGAFLANALVNVGRAVPSFGIIILAAPITLSLGLGIGTWPTLLALFALAGPPIFTNAYAAVTGVPPEAVESARGMGMTERAIVVRVEVATGAPLILAGLRIALVQVIATATIGAVLPFGGLGRFIIDGFAKGRGGHAEVISGAILVALLALGAERLFTFLERRALPRGVRRVVGTADVAGTAPAA